jgi:MerR family redox-sensitive transcriptional activator SoxR
MVISTVIEPSLAIGDVARAAGVRPSTIRYYERKGLLPAPPRMSGKRRYDEGILQLLRVIEVSKDAGFSLSEIEHLLHGFDRRTPPSERWRAMAEDKLSDIDALIARAEGMRALLKRGLECGCLTLEDCRLIE